MKVPQRPETRGREVERTRTMDAGLAYHPLPLRSRHQSAIIITNIIITNKTAASIALVTTKDGL